MRLWRSIKREGKFKREYIRRLRADHRDFKRYEPMIIQALHDNKDAACCVFDRYYLKDINNCIGEIFTQYNFVNSNNLLDKNN